MSKSMPVDVKKLLASARSVGEGRDLPVSVDLIFDPTADERLVELALAVFVDVDTGAHVSTTVLEQDRVPAIPMPCDVAVLVAGRSALLGDVASAARSLGAPCAVLVARGQTYFTTQAGGRAAADAGDDETSAREAAAASARDTVREGRGKGLELDDIVDIDLEADTPRPLEELGSWIVGHAPAKRLALAAAFPFVRHPLALELGRACAVQNGAIGLVFFVPGADMPLITANQVRMVLEIASVYGYPPDAERIREAVAVIAGGFGWRALARSLARHVPVAGWAVKPAVAASGTLALASAAAEYFGDEDNVRSVDEGMRKAASVALRVAETGASVCASVARGVRTGGRESADAAPAGADARGSSDKAGTATSARMAGV